MSMPSPRSRKWQRLARLDAHAIEQRLRVAGPRADGGFGDVIELAVVGEPLLREGLAQHLERFGEAVA
jgi:hypothetical protein